MTRLRCTLTALAIIAATLITLDAQGLWRPPSQGTLPAACTVGDIATKTGAGAGLYQCTATNTWTIVTTGSGFGAGTVTTTGSPASGNLTKFSGSTSVTNGDLSGDVTTSSSLVTTIANDAVTNAKLANMAQATIKLRAVGAGTGDPTDGTADQASAILDTAADPFVRLSQVPGGLAAAFWTGSIRRGVDSAGRNSSNTGTTLTDDGVLQFDMDANTLYTFDVWLLYSSPAGGGTPDFKFRFTGPATLTGVYVDLAYLGTSDLVGAIGANTVGANGAVGTAAGQRLYAARGWVISTAGGTGSSGFRVQWAQNTSNANSVILHAGSLLQYRKMV